MKHPSLASAQPSSNQAAPSLPSPAELALLLGLLVEEVRPLASAGRPASYIPALAQARSSAVGAALVLPGGLVVEAGESREAFTLQSVSKALALPYVLETRGEEEVFSRVGREPTGDPFNSIIRLEASKTRRPYNPMINAGAIVVSSLMPGGNPHERLEGFRAFAARLLGRPQLGLDEEVRTSESATADRNRSIAWFLKDLGLLGAGVEEALEVYFGQCALLVDAAALAHYGAVLALDGLDPASGTRLITERSARVTKALMQSCGLYDGSGAFGVEAGIPGKSGVGGGILATAKGRLGLGTYGPALDEHGNSLAGVRILTALSRELGLFGL